MFFLFLLWALSLIGYSVKSEPLPNEIENIVNSYVKPIKQLTEKFPNHEVELQIEFQGIQTPKPQRRVFVYNKQPQLRRRYKDLRNDIDITTVPTQRPPPATEETTLITTETTAVRPSDPSIHEKRPLYLEDLKKVFDEFASKIEAGKKCTGKHISKEYPQPIVISNPGPVRSSQNIEDIVDLIRRGVHVKKHVPKPTDEDLEWLQIEIPAT